MAKPENAEREKSFHDFIELIPDATIIVNQSGVIRLANDQALKLFGYAKHEMIDQAVEMLVPEDFRAGHPALRETFAAASSVRQMSSSLNLMARKKSGEQFPVVIGLSTLDILAEGRMVLASVRDDTELRDAHSVMAAQVTELRNISDTASDAIITIDTNSEILSWNAAATHIFGHAAEEAIGQHIGLIIPEHLQQGHREGIARIAGGGAGTLLGQTVVVEGLKMCGEIFPVEMSLSTWVGESGRRFGGILRDITERTEAEERLRIGEERLQHALRGGELGFWDINYETGEHVANDKYAEMLGYRLDEIDKIDEIALKTFHPDDRERVQQYNLRNRAGEIDDNEIEYRVITKQGETRWQLSKSMSVQKDDQGKPLRIVGTVLDITERKEAEEKLISSAARLRKMLEDSPSAIAISLDDESAEDGVLQFANSRFFELMGFTPEDIGTARTQQFMAEGAERENYEVSLDAGKSFRNMEVTVRKKNGEAVWALMSISPIRYRNRQCALIWLYDITERKQAEVALKGQSELIQLLHKTAVSANQNEDIDEALQECLDAICNYNSWPVGHVYRTLPKDPDTLVSTNLWHMDDPSRFVAFREITEQTSFERGVGLPGRVLESGKPEWIVDVTKDANFPRAKHAKNIGVRAGFAVPVLVGDEVVAVMEFFAVEAIEPEQDLLSVLVNISTQYGRVVERKRSEELITKAHKLITESVDYASNIQRSLLPTAASLVAALGDHFVLWEPRDMVGGDFYWLRRCRSGHLLIVCDCTGHGVPGAFMTLIGTGALNQALSEDPEGDPGNVLAIMNRFIKRSLLQDSDEGHADDGLELGVCRIEGAGNLTYAGARFSLVLSEQDGIREVKGDKTGIGYRGSDPDFEFTNHRINVTPDTKCYLYSDGIIDQVGGENRRGFGRKRLLRLLSELQDQPMAEQMTGIQHALVDYQDDEIRRDDVTVVGFKTI